MPQHRQINLSSLRKCSLPFVPTVFETTRVTRGSVVRHPCARVSAAKFRKKVGMLSKPQDLDEESERMI